MKKIAWIVFGIVIVFGSFIYFYMIMPFEASKFYNGFIYSSDGKVAEEIPITIHGQVDRNIFKDNIFVGTIRVTDELSYDFKMTKSMGEDNYHGVVLSKESNYTEIVGRVTTSKDFELMMADFDWFDEKYGVDTIIIGPASSIEEAKSISEQLMGGK